MEKHLIRWMRFLPRVESNRLLVGNAIDRRSSVAISGNLHSVKIKGSDIGRRHCAWPVF
jgi:hypothetical protein